MGTMVATIGDTMVDIMMGTMMMKSIVETMVVEILAVDIGDSWV